MAGPLEGIRVVDFSTWAVGPATCEVLGDWGAEVIKIEHPEGGDPTRGWRGIAWMPPGSPSNVGWLADNRSKKSITLDLSKDDGKDVAYKLIKKVDIFVSNLPADSLKKLRMDYETLRVVNDKLIYAHLTGYGIRGPSAPRPGYDYTAFWASSGIMSLMGEAGTPPGFCRPAFGDHVTTGYLIAGILAALYAREKSGVGQRVDTTLMGTGLWTVDWQAQATILTGKDAERANRKRMPNPMANSYQARDGSWFMLFMLFPERFWPPFCKALNIEHLEHDPRFDTTEKRAQNCEELISIIDEVMAGKTSAEWAPIFEKYDLVWAYVHTISGAINDPQTEANEFVVELDHPEIGKLKMVNSPIRFSGTPHEVKIPPPLLGQHTEEILLELGYDWDGIGKLKEKGVIM
jgi:crotonobetainyl-CoA:carnitine CoA-transferase CaiB-like acyl-CoA transferase